MKKSKIILLLLLLSIPAITFAQKSCTVTYTANEGFLAESGGRKIMIDALFGGIKGDWCEQPGDSILNLVINGKEPFGNIGYVLVTHRHVDHFVAATTADFLKSNASAILICPLQTKEMLSKVSGYDNFSDRIIYLSADDTTITDGGISIRALRMKHGSYFETDSATGKTYDRHKDTDNYVYLFSMNGFTFFHTGDCSTGELQRFRDCGIKSGTIDAGFFNASFFGKEGIEAINYLRPENIVMMHIEPSRREYYKSVYLNVPEIKIFGSRMESMQIQK